MTSQGTLAILSNMRNEGHHASLDLLRSLAMLGVFVYHLSPAIFPNAYLTVPLFFLLQGYLAIRALERRPKENTGLVVSLASLGRRIEKLYPPMLWLLLSMAILMPLRFPGFLAPFVKQLQASLLGMNNWMQIWQGDSYFEGAGYFKPLTHLWALSIQLQVYLGSAFLIAPWYRRRHREYWRGGFLALAFLSYALLWLLYPQASGATRVYYGTDTRLFSFLLGMALGSQPLSLRKKNVSDRRYEDFAAMAILALMVALASLSLPQALVIPYGLLLMSVLGMLFIGLTAGEEGILAAWGQSSLIQGMAKRSYLLYLLHYPIFALTEKLLVHVSLPLQLLWALQMSAAVFITEVVYLFVSASWKRLHKPLQLGLVLGLSLLLFFLPWGAIVRVVDDGALLELRQKIEAREAELAAMKEAHLAQPLATTVATEASEVTETAPASQPRLFAPLPPEDPAVLASHEAQAVMAMIRRFNNMKGDYVIDLERYPALREQPVTMIGDSVSVIASYHVKPYLPQLYLDAASNRQMHEVLAIYQDLKKAGLVHPLLVVALGSNGGVEEKDMQALMEAHADGIVVFVDVILPYLAEEQGRNAVIHDFVQKHPRAYLMAWNASAKGYASFFQEDHIHPSEHGCKAFCQLLTAKVMALVTADQAMGTPMGEGS